MCICVCVSACVQPCPWCGLLTSHYRGHDCHHIAPGGGCRSCHNHWCYLCGKKSRTKGTWAPGCDCAKTHQYCKLSGKCGCPICPDCRPGKPCRFCSGAKSCPSCNPNHPEHKEAKIIWEMNSFDYKQVNSKEELSKFVTQYKPKKIDLKMKWKFFVPDFIPSIGSFASVTGMCSPPRPSTASKTVSKTSPEACNTLPCHSGMRCIRCPDQLCNNIYRTSEVVCPRCGRCPQSGSPWDLARMGKQVVLAAGSNLRVCKRTASWQGSTAVLKGSLVIPKEKAKGQRRWSFRIKQGTKIVVGLVTDQIDQSAIAPPTKLKGGWGYDFGTGRLGHDGVDGPKKYHSADKHDSTVDVEVDLASRTLRFYIDGVDKGVAFKNLPTNKPLSAAVSLFSKGDKVEVVEAGGDLWQSCTNRVGKGVSIRGLLASKDKRGWEDGTAIMRDPVRVSPTTYRKWHFVVERGEQNTIGVVTDDYKPLSHSYINKTKRGWGYYQGDGKKGHCGSANQDYGVKYEVGDRVAVEIRGTALHFWVNGADQGKAFDLTSGVRIWPALSLYDKDDALSIDAEAMLSNNHEEDTRNLRVSGVTPRFINGIYTRAGTFKGCNCYKKRGESKAIKKQCITVRRAGPESKWVISMNETDRSNEGDLYECMGDPFSATPPTDSCWTLVGQDADLSQTKVRVCHPR